MSQTLPRYRCHKVVSALRIAGLTPTASNDTDLNFVEHGFAPIRVTEAWLTAHPAKVGGYYVVYEDGYASYSPADAFEAGYTLIDNAGNAFEAHDV